MRLTAVGCRMRILRECVGAGVFAAVGTPLHGHGREDVVGRLVQRDVLARHVADLVTADVAAPLEEGVRLVYDDACDRSLAVGHLLETPVAAVVGHQVDHVAVTVEYGCGVVVVETVGVVDVHGDETSGAHGHLAAFERHLGVDVGVGQLVDEAPLRGQLFGRPGLFGDDVVLRHAAERVALGVAPLGQREALAPEFEFVISLQVVLLGVGRDQSETQRGVGVLHVGRAVVDAQIGFLRGLGHGASGHVGRGPVADDRAAYGDVLIEGDLAFRLRDQPAQLLEGHLAGLRRTARDTLIGCEIGCVIFAPVIPESQTKPCRAGLEFLVVGDPEPEILEILGVADAVGPRFGSGILVVNDRPVDFLGQRNVGVDRNGVDRANGRILFSDVLELQERRRAVLHQVNRVDDLLAGR